MYTIPISRFDDENFARPRWDVEIDELAWLCSDLEDEFAEAEAADHSPVFGPAEAWPDGPWDRWTWGLGPEPTPGDDVPLGPADSFESWLEYLERTRGEDEDPPYEPTPEDLHEFELWCERIAYESGCNMRPI